MTAADLLLAFAPIWAVMLCGDAVNRLRWAADRRASRKRAFAARIRAMDDARAIAFEPRK